MNEEKEKNIRNKQKLNMKFIEQKYSRQKVNYSSYKQYEEETGT